MPIKSVPFGRVPDGAEVEAWTLQSMRLSVTVLTYGATIASIVAPDRSGSRANVVLGYADLDGYLSGTTYYGATVGRFANRIAEASYTLDGIRHVLLPNDGRHTLHGGPRGFDKVIWTVNGSEEHADGAVLELVHCSDDGDQGFSGRMTTETRFTLQDGQLAIDYHATTDAPTVVNLTNHSYFNLRGSESGSLNGQQLQINASRYLPIDGECIPTGEVAKVDGTRFDLRKPRAVPEGIDHNFILDGDGLKTAARALDPVTGRTLTVFTTEPGVQLYTGDRNGFTLETQHFPDTPNRPTFPSTTLRPGQEFVSRTVLRFETV